MDGLQEQVRSLENGFNDFTANIREVMKLHNETHEKQHEIYQGAFVERVNSIAQSVTYVQTQLPNIATKQDVEEIENRVRRLELDVQTIQANSRSDDENRAMWILVGLTLLSAVIGLLSNVIGYVIS